MVDRPWIQADTNTNQIDLGTTCTIHKSIAKRMRKTYAVAPWHKTKEGEGERVSFDPWRWLCRKDGRQGGRGCDVRRRIDVVGSDFAQRGECI